MASQHYRLIEHTADTGFEVSGESREQVFEAAARAFFDIMWRVGGCVESPPEIIKVTGNDLQELMVNFLEEFLYLYDAKGLVCSQLNVETVTDTDILARARLQQFNDKTDMQLLGVKAVTYHQLFIGEKGNKWLARVFLDI